MTFTHDMSDIIYLGFFFLMRIELHLVLTILINLLHPFTLAPHPPPSPPSPHPSSTPVGQSDPVPLMFSVCSGYQMLTFHI